MKEGQLLDFWYLKLIQEVTLDCNYDLIIVYIMSLFYLLKSSINIKYKCY